MSQSISASGHMPHSIERRHDGRRVLLPVLILPPTPSTDLTGVEAMALLDTGSTTTGVTARVARSLCLAPKGKRPIGSIQGEGQAERYLIRVALKLPQPSFPFVFDDVEGFE